MSQKIYEQLNAGKPVEVEVLFPNCTFRRDAKKGPVHRVSFEVERELWEAFVDLPSSIRLRSVLWIQADDEGASEQDTVAEIETPNGGQPDANGDTPTKRQRTKKAPKDERTAEQIVNGKAWSLLLHKRGFARCPGVWEAIGEVAGKDDHEHRRGGMRARRPKQRHRFENLPAYQPEHE